MKIYTTVLDQYTIKKNYVLEDVWLGSIDHRFCNSHYVHQDFQSLKVLDHGRGDCGRSGDVGESGESEGDASADFSETTIFIF